MLSDRLNTLVGWIQIWQYVLYQQAVWVGEGSFSIYFYLYFRVGESKLAIVLRILLGVKFEFAGQIFLPIRPLSHNVSSNSLYKQ